MNVQKIGYNTNNQPQFGARFPKADLQKAVKEVKDSEYANELIPRLYTSLEYLDSIFPGKKLKLKEYVMGREVVLPSQEVKLHMCSSAFLEDDKEHLCSYSSDSLSAIEQLFLEDPAEKLASKQYLRMPKSVYENLWWKNRNVKAEDIEKFAFDVEA